MQLDLDTAYMKAHVDDHIGWMTFANAERLNAMKMEMNESIVTILEAFGASDDVRVVVMSGEGDRAFASGADISEFETHRSSPDARERYDAVAAAAGRAMAQFDKPLVAMIRGFCMGGGLATALQADLRFSADDGQFAIPAARLGLGYGFAGIDRLTHVVGPAMAAEMLLTARRFSAAEAYEMGLINRVLPVEELEPAVREVAGRIAANAPLTVRAAKAAVRETFKDPARRDLDRIEALVEACFRSRDYAEGRSAFMEKRTPNFEGR